MNLKRAKEIREKVKVIKKMEDTHNIFNTITDSNVSLGYVYFRDDLREESIDEFKGLYTKVGPNNREKLILLNGEASYYDQRASATHEFGHSKVHSSVNYCKLTELNKFENKDNEVEANYFAGEYLISDEELLEYPCMTYDQVSSALYVPEEMVRLKFKYLDKSLLPNTEIFHP